MAWPRGCALAEVAWAGDKRPGFEDFRKRLQKRTQAGEEVMIKIDKKWETEWNWFSLRIEQIELNWQLDYVWLCDTWPILDVFSTCCNSFLKLLKASQYLFRFRYIVRFHLFMLRYFSEGNRLIGSRRNVTGLPHRRFCRTSRLWISTSERFDMKT